MALQYMKIFELLLDPVFNLKNYIYQDKIYGYVYRGGLHYNDGEILENKGKTSQENQFTIAHFIITIDKNSEYPEFFKHQKQLIKLLIDSGANFNIKADGCASNKTASELIFRDVSELDPEHQIPRIKLRIAFINHLLIHTKYLDDLGILNFDENEFENKNEYMQEKINYLTNLDLIMKEIPENINSMGREEIKKLEDEIKRTVDTIIDLAISASSNCDTEKAQNALTGILNSMTFKDENSQYIINSISNLRQNQFNILVNYQDNLGDLAEKIVNDDSLLKDFSTLYNNTKNGSDILYKLVNNIISEIDKKLQNTENQDEMERLDYYKTNLNMYSNNLLIIDIDNKSKSNEAKNDNFSNKITTVAIYNGVKSR